MFEDALSQAQNAFSRFSSGVGQSVQQAVQNPVQTAEHIGSGVAQTLAPNIAALHQTFQNAGQALQQVNQQGFYNTPVAKGIENVANTVVPAAANMKNISESVPGIKDVFQFVDNANDQLSKQGVLGKIGSTLASLPISLAKGDVNIPSNIVRGSANLGTQLGLGESGQPVDYRKVLGGVGDVGEGLLNASTLGGGAHEAFQTADTLLGRIGQGVKQGAQFGGAYGVLSGLHQNQQGSLANQIGQAGLSGVQNAAIGGVLGGGMHTAGEAFSGAKELFDTSQKAQITKVINSSAINEDYLNSQAGIQTRQQKGQYGSKTPDIVPTAGFQGEISPFQNQIASFEVQGDHPNQTQVMTAQQIRAVPDWQKNVQIVGPFNSAAKQIWRQHFQSGSINFNAALGENEEPKIQDTDISASSPQEMPTRTAEQETTGVFPEGQSALGKNSSGNPLTAQEFEQSLDNPISSGKTVSQLTQQLPEQAVSKLPAQQGEETKDFSIAKNNPLEEPKQTQKTVETNYQTASPISIPQETNPFQTPQGDLSKPLKTQDIKNALIQRDAVDQSVRVRANVLTNQLDRVFKSPEQVNAFRDTIEHPENLEANAAKANVDPTTFQKLTQQFSNFTDYLHSSHLNTGNQIGKVENYYPHIFDTSSKEYQTALSSAKARDFSGFYDKTRVFDDLNQAADAGVSPKNAKLGQDISEMTDSNTKELQSNIFSQQLAKVLPEDVFHSKSGEAGPPGFTQSRIPGMQGTYFSKRLTDLTKNLEPTDFGTGAKIIDQINTIAKGIKLAGGGFHYLNMAKGFTAGSLGQGQVPNFVGVAQSALSRNFFDVAMQKAVENGTVDKAGQMGVDFHASEFKPEGLTGKVKQLIDNNPLTAPLFQRMIPYMQMKMVQGAPNFDLTTAEGKSQSAAYGKQINAAVGVINDSVGDSFIKNPQMKYLARLGVLAPMYQESRVAQLATAANPTKFDRATNYARAQQVIGIALTAGLEEAGRKIMTGNFSPDMKSFIQNAVISPNIPTGTQNAKGINQVAALPAGPLSDVWNAGKETAQTGFPTHFAIAHAGALASNGFQFLSNQDYYGSPLSKTNSTAEKLGKIGINQLPVPAVQALKTQGIGDQIPQDARTKLGITVNQTPTQSAVNTLGFRIKSDPNDPNYQKQQQFFKALDLSKQNNLTYPQSQELQKLQQQGLDPNTYIEGINAQRTQNKQDRTDGVDLQTQKYNALKSAIAGDPTSARQLGFTGAAMRLGIAAQMRKAADLQLAGEPDKSQTIQQDMGGRQIPQKIMMQAAHDRSIQLLQVGKMYQEKDPAAFDQMLTEAEQLKNQYGFQITPQDKIKLGIGK